MNYNPDNDTIEPEKGNAKAPEITDFNVLKRGPAAMVELTTRKRKQDFMKEDVFLNAEEDRIQK